RALGVREALCLDVRRGVRVEEVFVRRDRPDELDECTGPPRIDTPDLESHRVHHSNALGTSASLRNPQTCAGVEMSDRPLEPERELGADLAGVVAQSRQGMSVVAEEDRRTARNGGLQLPALDLCSMQAVVNEDVDLRDSG